MKLLLTALIALTSFNTAFADSQSTGNHTNNLLELRASITMFEVQKEKLLEEIAVNTVLAMQLERDVNFIESYAQGKLSLDSIVIDHPVASNGAFTAAVYAAAKFFNTKIVNPALLKEEAGLITSLMQKFPKLSKSTAWVTGLAATAAAIYYTVDRAVAYADLKLKTAEEIGDMYTQKRNELQMRKDTVVVATRELIGINHDLNMMKEQEMKATVGHVK